MNEFNRVLEGDYVNRLLFIYFIEERSKGGCLAAAGRASDEHKAVFLFRDLLENRREIKLTATKACRPVACA